MPGEGGRRLGAGRRQVRRCGERPRDTRSSLSTASVFPERTADAFDLAARLGYDGVEVMVTADPVSQDAEVLGRLADYHGVPVLAVHAPCLLITQRVWGREPWAKLVKAAEVADKLGAKVVVVHPPFRWQREYAREFEAGLARAQAETDVMFAVENLYPLRAGKRRGGRLRAALEPGRAGRRQSRSTCRTPRCPARTPWRWPTSSASGWPTCTSPTGRGPGCPTSTWCPAGAASRAPAA